MKLVPRIFKRDQKDLPDIWGRVLTACSNQIEDGDLGRLDKHVFQTVMISGIDTAQEFETRFMRSSPHAAGVTWTQALALSEVFVAAMIARFVRHLSDRNSDIDVDEMWLRLTRDSQEMLGSQHHRFTEARAMRAQFEKLADAIRDKDRDSLFSWQSTEVQLLFLLGARALDHPIGRELNLEGLPVRTSYELWQATGIEHLETDVALLTEAMDFLLACETGMYVFFNTLHQQDEAGQSNKRQ